MNSTIETMFNNFYVDGKEIPVSFKRYDGKSTTYVTYMQLDNDNSLSAEDEIINYVSYYDFDIYSKGNYLNIVKRIKEIMRANGWKWQPSRDSEDMYENDTGYFHKTLCFAIEMNNETEEIPSV